MSEFKWVDAVCGVWGWNCGIGFPIGSVIGSGYEEYDALLGFAIDINFQGFDELNFFMVTHCSAWNFIWVLYLWDGGKMAHNLLFRGLSELMKTDGAEM